MKSPDKMTLGRSLTKLLRQGKASVGLSLNEAGWASINDVASAAADLLRRDVKVIEIQRLAHRDNPRRFEFDSTGALVRAVLGNKKDRLKGKGRKSGSGKNGHANQDERGSRLPDILYHATTFGRQQLLVKSGNLYGQGGRSLYLSSDEGAAWRVAHCMRKRPAVLVVDTQRMLNSGGRLKASKGGLFITKKLPRSAVLNVHRGYAEQHSAGGILVRKGDAGFEFALVSCQRKRRTWEVAKGKIEPGESAVEAAKRELQEEMGFVANLTVVEDLGMVRYAFTIPNGAPRLKAMHLFLFEADPEPITFNTALDEGIMGVEWVSPQEAQRRVVHSSLRPIMRMLANRYY